MRGQSQGVRQEHPESPDHDDRPVGGLFLLEYHTYPLGNSVVFRRFGEFRLDVGLSPSKTLDEAQRSVDGAEGGGQGHKVN